MTYRSSVPEPAASYFAQFEVAQHPIIAATYKPGEGWRPYPIRKRVSAREIRRLRQDGHTSVRLDAGGHRADFQLREFHSEMVGLGPFPTYDRNSANR